MELLVSKALRDDSGPSLERVTRIELAYAAWEAAVLPLNYTRAARRILPRVVADSPVHFSNGTRAVSRAANSATSVTHSASVT